MCRPKFDTERVNLRLGVLVFVLVILCFLIVLGKRHVNPSGHFVSFPRDREKRDRRDS